LSLNESGKILLRSTARSSSGIEYFIELFGNAGVIFTIYKVLSTNPQVKFGEANNLEII